MHPVAIGAMYALVAVVVLLLLVELSQPDDDAEA